MKKILFILSFLFVGLAAYAQPVGLFTQGTDTLMISYADISIVTPNGSSGTFIYQKKPRRAVAVDQAYADVISNSAGSLLSFLRQDNVGGIAINRNNILRIDPDTDGGCVVTVEEPRNVTYEVVEPVKYVEAQYADKSGGIQPSDFVTTAPYSLKGKTVYTGFYYTDTLWRDTALRAYSFDTLEIKSSEINDSSYVTIIDRACIVGTVNDTADNLIYNSVSFEEMFNFVGVNTQSPPFIKVIGNGDEAGAPRFVIHVSKAGSPATAALFTDIRLKVDFIIDDEIEGFLVKACIPNSEYYQALRQFIAEQYSVTRQRVGFYNVEVSSGFYKVYFVIEDDIDGFLVDQNGFIVEEISQPSSYADKGSYTMQENVCGQFETGFIIDDEIEGF